MTLYTAGKQHLISIPSANVKLPGLLYLPKDAFALVLFVHGSGSNLSSPRNQYVATILNQANLGTLLFDLLTPEEDAIDNCTREYRFNIPFLAQRLINVTHWGLKKFANSPLNVGFFGASTGGGAALLAASQMPFIKAVVSRGGRPDLAGEALALVKAPTLLIVGELDPEVIELNQKAKEKMLCHRQLEIIPRATHLFEEPGTLAQVADLAKSWFTTYVRPGKQ